MSRRDNRRNRWRWWQRLASLPLALVVLFEEWGWQPLQRAMGWLARRLHLVRLERWIAALPPWAALGAFALPSLALVPVKLAALALIARGHAPLGALVIVAAKLAGTAVVARLFTLTRPALMRLPWFARLYTRWTHFKHRLLGWVRASWAWRWLRAQRMRLRRTLRRAWQRWRAAA